MRIDRLEIESYKNLERFAIDFDERELAAVLIGENGAGKSNLIEAIVQIFRSLDLTRDTPPPFRYAIRYRCRGMIIDLKTGPKKSGPEDYEIIVTRIDGSKESIPWSTFFKRRNRYLPAYIFAYYSGPGKRLEQLFRRHRRRWDTALSRNREKPRALPRLFYCKPEHSRLALLTYFIQGTSDPSFLRDHFQVDGVDSAMVVLKKPRKMPPSADRFWGVLGRVSDFLEQMWDVALAPMRLGREESLVYLYFPNADALLRLGTAPGEAALNRVVDTRRTALQVFSKLDALLSYGMLHDLQIRVRSGESQVPFAELSEGEQQFLTVIGLLRFTQEQESLFLLDEPDTHLNPRWKLDYLRQLKENAGSDDTSQLIFSTHDPLTIADLKRTQVHIFSRDDQDGRRVKVEHPLEDPRGLGVTGVLTELFGLPTTLDQTTQQKLDERERLASKEGLTDGERQHLQSLSRELRHLGFADERRDPVEARFLSELRKWQREESRLLSQVPVAEQRRIVQAILKRIKAERAAS